jgi:transcriptional regulator with XRE-family HTH domain
MKNRVRVLRLEAGLTQIELASRAGMPHSTLARIDANPRAGIPLDKALPIAEALHIDVRELLPA